MLLRDSRSAPAAGRLATENPEAKWDGDGQNDGRPVIAREAAVRCSAQPPPPPAARSICGLHRRGDDVMETGSEMRNVTSLGQPDGGGLEQW